MPSSNAERKGLSNWTANTKVSTWRISTPSNRRHRFSNGRVKISEQEWVSFSSRWSQSAHLVWLFLHFSNVNLWTSIFFLCRSESARQTTLLTATSRTHFVRVHPRLIKLPRSPVHPNRSLCKLGTLVVQSRMSYTSYSQDFQFFPPELTVLQERELAVHKVTLLSTSRVALFISQTDRISIIAIEWYYCFSSWASGTGRHSRKAGSGASGCSGLHR